MVVPPNIQWSKNKYERFYTDVHNALECGLSDDHTITFENHVFELGWAKQLLAYLEPRVYRAGRTGRVGRATGARKR
jgi:hypothetical protein